MTYERPRRARSGRFQAPIPSTREAEHKSIYDFLCGAAEEGLFSGRVLDYGAGRQPYRAIIEAAGGEYVPYDAPTFPASVAKEDTTGQAWGRSFDTLLITQVIQYVERPGPLLYGLRARFGPTTRRTGAATLVMTYPTNWPEVEREDLHRFTKAGMARLLTEAGYTIVRHEERQTVAVTLDGERLAAGYGVIARVR